MSSGNRLRMVSQAKIYALDWYPRAAAAYSFRRLSSNYSGPAVTLRRNSDNVMLDIGFVGADFDTAAAAAFLGAATGLVTAMYDQSGHGATMTQATSSRQPTYVSAVAALNNKPAALFIDNTGTHLNTIASGVSLAGLFATGGSASSVVNSTGTPTNLDRFWGTEGTVTNTGISLGYNAASSNAMRISASASATSGSWRTTSTLSTGAHAVDMAWSYASLAIAPIMFWDGTKIVFTTNTQAVGTIVDQTGMAIGGRYNIGVPNSGFPGHIGETIFFNQWLNLNVLRANQKAYWGTP